MKGSHIANDRPDSDRRFRGASFMSEVNDLVCLLGGKVPGSVNEQRYSARCWFIAGGRWHAEQTVGSQTISEGFETESEIAFMAPRGTSLRDALVFPMSCDALVWRDDFTKRTCYAHSQEAAAFSPNS
jgi:hypothetical protein